MPALLIYESIKNNMKRKTVVITGASRGIGRALALDFAQQGHRVLALARSAEALEDLAQEAEGAISTLVVDINSPEAAAEAIAAQCPSIDILIHNAAAFFKAPFEQVGLGDLQATYHTNVFVPYLLTQKLLAQLGRGAHVVAISSVGGIGGSMKFAGLSVYSSSKAALNIMVECLAEELRERGIFVNALALGSSATEMFQSAFPGMEAASKPKEMAHYIAQFALSAPPLINGKLQAVSSQNP